MIAVTNTHTTKIEESHPDFPDDPRYGQRTEITNFGDTHHFLMTSEETHLLFDGKPHSVNSRPAFIKKHIIVNHCGHQTGYRFFAEEITHKWAENGLQPVNSLRPISCFLTKRGFIGQHNQVVDTLKFEWYWPQFIIGCDRNKLNHTCDWELSNNALIPKDFREMREWMASQNLAISDLFRKDVLLALKMILPSWDQIWGVSNQKC